MASNAPSKMTRMEFVLTTRPPYENERNSEWMSFEHIEFYCYTLVYAPLDGGGVNINLRKEDGGEAQKNILLVLLWAPSKLQDVITCFAILKGQCQPILSNSYTSKFPIKLKNNDCKHKVNQ